MNVSWDRMPTVLRVRMNVSWVGCQHLYAIMSDIRMTCMCLDVGRQQLYSMVSPLTTLPRTRMRVNESSSWIPTNIHASFHCVTPRCASSCIYMYNTHTHACIFCIYACTHTHTHTHTHMRNTFKVREHQGAQCSLTLNVFSREYIQSKGASRFIDADSDYYKVYLVAGV